MNLSQDSDHAWVSTSTLDDLANCLEILAYAVYLTAQESGSPDQVRAYMKMSEQRIQASAARLQSIGRAEFLKDQPLK